MKMKLLLLINHLRLHWKKIFKSFPLLLIIGSSLFTAHFFYNKYQKTASLLADVQKREAQKKDDTVILDKIRAIIELPEEEPSIATVTDVESIKSQPFFVKAKNDDVVLIFHKEAKALLYRPSDNKIINWAFVNTGQVAGAASNAASPTPAPSAKPNSITVALFNGTARDGLTKVAQERLTGALPEVKIITKANAVKNNYQKTTVVDVTGSNQALAARLVSELGGEINSLPEGEATPSAQVVIILGEDFQK